MIDSLLTQHWGASGRSHEEMGGISARRHVSLYAAATVTFVFIWDCKL